MMRSLLSGAAAGVLLVSAGCSTSSEPPQQIEIWEVLPGREMTEVLKKAEQVEQENAAELEALQKLPDDPYRISPSDVFDFNVYEHEDLKVYELTVTPDGYVGIPLLGACKIGGLTLPEATDELKRRADKYIRNPKVALIPRQVKGFAYTIGGRGERPGRYPLSTGMRLQDAMATAWGIAHGDSRGESVETADLKTSYILRDGRKLPVSFEKALLKGDMRHNIPLRNGDYIYLLSAMDSSVYVLGEVNSARHVLYKVDLTLAKALVFAAGLKDTHGDYALVFRGTPEKETVFKINLANILEGREVDFPLAPNDMVFIPKSGLSAYNINWINQFLPTLQMLNLLAGPFGNAALYMGIK